MDYVKITPMVSCMITILDFKVIAKASNLNIDNDRKGYNMSPTKNRKRLFFNFHMKFMMYLDYSN